MITNYDPPRSARIIDSVYSRFGPALARRGLQKQEFRVEGIDPDTVIIHADDFKPNSSIEERRIRRDIVEFLSESES